METRARTRIERVISLLDTSLVETDRVIEREAGGPPVALNSLNVSIVDLTARNVSQENIRAEETVFLDTSNEEEVVNSNSDQEGVQPGIVTLRYVSVVDNNLDEVDTTIDLTDSPPRVREMQEPSSLDQEGPRERPMEGLMEGPMEEPMEGPMASLFCPVCLDSYAGVMEKGNRVLSTRCGHIFCSFCLPRSLATSDRCPTCRHKVGPMDYHPIYLY